MNNLLYYPGFEVKDQNWLKFALLYLDDLRPIIPNMAMKERRYFSDSFKTLLDETDLISPYRPMYEEGSFASALACEQFDKMLSFPERFVPFLSKRDRALQVQKWRHPEQQKCMLFNEKYSNVFHEYCLENKLATECDEGIMISEELAFVYMSLLADIISKNNEFEMITDQSKYSNLLIRNDKALTAGIKNKFKFAQCEIELSIPADIKNIPLDVFICLRKNRDFNECRKAYMIELQKLIEARNTGDVQYSLSNILSYKKDLLKLCERSFDMIASATLTICGLISLVQEQTLGTIITALSAYNDYKAVKDALRDTPKILNNLKSKRLAKKYVAKLHSLNTTIH